MAKVKVVGGNLDQNLNGGSFDNTASQTIFQFGRFKVTSNFDGRTFIDYSNELSTFVRSVTLETLNISNVKSEDTVFVSKNAVLNLDRSDLNTFVRFGSAYELLRTSIQNIITNYPGSLFVSSQIQRSGNISFYDFTFDSVRKISKFKIPSIFTVNKFNLIFNYGNNVTPNDNENNNINLSFNNYVIWTKYNPNDNSHNIIGFTGDTASRDYLMVECYGNPFPELSGVSSGRINYHLKPNLQVFDNFRISLKNFEKSIVVERNETDGFIFNLKDPTLLDNGKILYDNRKIQWDTPDGYNIAINGPSYSSFLERVLTIGNKYDQVKTDLIARFLTPTSLQVYDTTDEKKVSKLLRLYGAEFDQLRQFIDSLVYVNRVTYDKKNNLPDQIVSNLARMFGWDYFQLVNEEQLVENLFSAVEPERNLNTDLTPPEVDIELWRRILINTNYFWKSKGTRDAIKSMFRLVGIPEPFINITEYVYTVDGKIDPNEVGLSLEDLPSATLPYNTEGYPIAPEETNDFYFQISGNNDSGQAYLNVFRDVGFNLLAHVDNKKSWIEDGSTYRDHYSSPQYYQLNSKLVLNTKEVDVALDTSRGIEYDVYKYVKEIDFPANSTGFTLPFTYVNLSLDVPVGGTQTFVLPDEPEGDIEVRFNGLLLNGPKYWDGNTLKTAVPPNPAQYSAHTDYYFTGPKTFQIYGGVANNNGAGNRDVIEVTYVYRQGSGLAQVTVRYIVARIAPSIQQATIPLPETPAGDVQLTINGVAATRGTPQFIADYVVNGDDIVIQNPDLIAYFATNPYVQVAYITVSGSNSIFARNEINRIDTLFGGKVYFNNNINRAVYRLNYRVVNPENVKILVDGIALEPGTDYTVNPNNPYEVYLPPGINLGSVISAYYIVGDSAAFDPIIGGNFGLGDISNLSFLEFIELVQKRLVNATNRKVITDFKGGWYPTLLKVYTTYLSRANLDDQDPLKSNGYTFQNLYPFLNKYNAFFQTFVDQLLSATIIQKKSGLLIRNTIFTKQKFTYKRGVYFGIITGDTNTNRATKFIFDPELNYFGSDGATYIKTPLIQRVNWTDDEVIVEDLCDNFIIDNVRVEYPTTTTTTTAAPYEAILKFVQTDDSQQTGSDMYLYKNNVEFAPVILPNYNVNVTFKIEFELISDSLNNEVYYNVIFKNNGSEVYSRDRTINENTNSLPVVVNTYTTSFDITISDSYEITMESNATFNGTTPPVVGTIKITPTINSVTPNGDIVSIIPSVLSNSVAGF